LVINNIFRVEFAQISSGLALSETTRLIAIVLVDLVEVITLSFTIISGFTKITWLDITKRLSFVS